MSTLGFIFILLLITSLLVYSYLVGLFAWGWKHIPPPLQRQDHGAALFVSVIAAMRNEEDEAEGLLEQLALQDHPMDKLEVIIVDDHSEDRTSEVIRQWMDRNPSFPLKLLSLEEGRGKKMALRLGIGEASGEVILTTDADCRPGSRWVSSYSEFMMANAARMVFGPVLPKWGSNFAGIFQELEFMSLVGSSAGASGAGKPFLCNGANLAFYRHDFYSAGGYDSHFKIASGDDVFLLHAFKEEFGKNSICFLKSVDAVVTTPLQPTVASFLNQRKRWASKSFYYRDLFSHTVALSVFLLNFLLFLGLAGFPFNLLTGSITLLALIVKGFVDLMILYPVARFAGRRSVLYLLPVFEVMYMFYSTYTALSSFFTKYEWKGRKQKV